MANFLGDVGGTAQAIGSPILQIGFAIFYVIIISIPFTGVFYYMKHNHKALWLEGRGSGMFTYKFVRLRKIKDKDGVIFYRRMFNFSEKLRPPPDFKTVFSAGKGEGLIIYHYSPNDYSFANFRPESGLSVTSADMQVWGQQMRRQSSDKYMKQKFWDKYGGIIMHMASVGAFVVVVIFILEKFSVLQGVASSLDSTAQSLKQAAEVLAAARGGSGGPLG